MDLLEIGLSVVDWIGLAQDMYRWRALVNVVIGTRNKLQLQYNEEWCLLGCYAMWLL
jgi:hypothetical protein